MRRKIMDPDTALMNLREALNDEDLDAAREAFDALDQWLTRGGFPPADWMRDVAG